MVGIDFDRDLLIAGRGRWRALATVIARLPGLKLPHDVHFIPLSLYGAKH